MLGSDRGTMRVQARIPPGRRPGWHVTLAGPIPARPMGSGIGGSQGGVGTSEPGPAARATAGYRLASAPATGAQGPAGPSASRVDATSRSIWATRASTVSNRRSSRRRSTNDTLAVSV